MKRKIKSKAKIIYDNEGNKIGVVMTIKELDALIEELEDLHGLRMIYERT